MRTYAPSHGYNLPFRQLQSASQFQQNSFHYLITSNPIRSLQTVTQDLDHDLDRVQLNPNLGNDFEHDLDDDLDDDIDHDFDNDLDNVFRHDRDIKSVQIILQ